MRSEILYLAAFLLSCASCMVDPRYDHLHPSPAWQKTDSFLKLKKDDVYELAYPMAAVRVRGRAIDLAAEPSPFPSATLDGGVEIFRPGHHLLLRILPAGTQIAVDWIWIHPNPGPLDYKTLLTFQVLGDLGLGLPPLSAQTMPGDVNPDPAAPDASLSQLIPRQDQFRRVSPLPTRTITREEAEREWLELLNHGTPTQKSETPDGITND